MEAFRNFAGAMKAIYGGDFLNNMSFNIIANKLSSLSFAKSLLVENEHYVIKIFYAGDYDDDKLNNKINIGNISISCNPKDVDFMIDYMNGQLVIDLSPCTILFPNEIEDFKNKLDIVKGSVAALDKIIREFFI